jgi:uncharacterized membrane protein
MNLEYIGSLVCHQAPDRTIQMGGKFLPLCSRCTGIYLGFLLGILYQFTVWQTKVRELPCQKISIVSVSLLGLLIIDSLGSYLKLWSLSNYQRLVLGLLGGSSISLFLFPVFNYSLFVKSKEEKGIKLLIEYLGVLLLLELATLFILSGRFIIYNIIAFASVLGILVLYLMINATIAGRIINWQNRRNTVWRNVFSLAGITLILTIIEFYLLRGTHLKL